MERLQHGSGNTGTNQSMKNRLNHPMSHDLQSRETPPASEKPDPFHRSQSQVSAASRYSHASDSDAMYECIDDENGQSQPYSGSTNRQHLMGGRRQAAVDKLDRTITRLYNYLSGSDGEDESPQQPSNGPHSHAQRLSRITAPPSAPQARYHLNQHSSRGGEPEYQQPYSYPPPPHPVTPLYNQQDTPTSDHASSEATFTGSQLALSRDATLPVSFHNSSARTTDERLEGHDVLQQQQYSNSPANTTGALGRSGCVNGPCHPQQQNPHSNTNYPPQQHAAFLAMHRLGSHVPPSNTPNSLHHMDPDDLLMPSLLKRTPSGSLFIPSDLPKNTSLDYKHNLNSPTKSEKLSDRIMVPFDARLRLGGVRPQSSPYSPSSPRVATLDKHGNWTSYCTWKCTAIVFILCAALLAAALAYLTASYLVSWPPESAKTPVLVSDANTDSSGGLASTMENATNHRPEVAWHTAEGSASAVHDGVGILWVSVERMQGDDDQGDEVLVLSSNAAAQDRLKRRAKREESAESPGSTTLPPTTKKDEFIWKMLEAWADEDAREAEEESELLPQDLLGVDNLALMMQDAPILAEEGDVLVGSGAGDFLLLPKSMSSKKNRDFRDLPQVSSTDEPLQDAPIFSYDSHEIEIVQLEATKKPPISSSSTDHPKHLVITPVVESMGMNLKNASGESADDHHPTTTLGSPQPKLLVNASMDALDELPSASSVAMALPRVESIIIPNDEKMHGKRVLVNVTIATDDAEPSDQQGNRQHASQLHPVYVLSISVPTDGGSPTSSSSERDMQAEVNLSPQVLLSLAGNVSEDVLLETWKTEPTHATEVERFIPPTSSPPLPIWPFMGGAHCQCTCPCMEAEAALVPNSEKIRDIPPQEKNESTEAENPTTTAASVQQADAITTATTTTTHQTISTRSTTDPVEAGTENATLNDGLPFPIEDNDGFDTEDELDESEEEFSPPNPEAEVSTDRASTTESSTTATPCCTCEKVPPILILEGASTFPARTFPPDGTTFAQMSLGEKVSSTIPGYSYWNMQFYQSEAAYVRFEFNIPRGASLGLYARRNALPTHTHYDVIEVLSGYKSRTTRASPPSVAKEVVLYLEPGHWFVSLYNDDGDPQEVTCVTSIAQDMTLHCPRGCSGNGECLLGKCQCKSGFGGEDCSESICPLLCSGRGEYVNGRCQCHPGWKGRECSFRHDECEVPDCHGHGQCTHGKCICARGFKGEFCDQVDCPNPTCSDHGYCLEGTCVCKRGWKGLDCSQIDSDSKQCLPDCSGQGTFNLELQKCICNDGWTGEDCSKEMCGLNCGGHGRCEAGACVCDMGWTGELCNERQCDPRCNDHGQCKNGTCLCITGWNGRHCSLEGCPRDCSRHGQCKTGPEGDWACRCDRGWEGLDCSTPIELECDDGKDNDKDGLTDCEDSECCPSRHCKKSPLCVTSPKPIDILLRKQPPAITASFFERMKFLIEEGSLQSYAKQDAFNESLFWSHFNASRTAVVRGRVLTPVGVGLLGVRVSSSNPLEGFTLTRDDGWFDLMVNGGGAVVLQFGRSPFKPQTRTVFAPWNEVVILDTIVMSTEDEKTVNGVPHMSCEAHDYDLMKPVVLATWKHGFQGSCPAQSTILAESQVVQESLTIPGTGVHLVYHSSRSAGYLSTIQLQLTPDVIPSTLIRIHLRITIEGILFEKIFEADPDIKYTYAWNRFNVYRQRVYGVTTALVKVGYVYNSCQDIIWDVQTTKLSGHDMSISEIGGWNLDIHHRYNFHEGILQKGDGTNLYLKYRPEMLRTTMGDGHQRPLDCPDCDGLAIKQRLLAPVALAAGQDGSLYVGDFNYVRRVSPDGMVKTILRLNATRVSYRYYMAVSPVDGTLFLSDPEAHQIIKIKQMEDVSDPERNWEPAVGSGDRCLPGDEAQCGDGGLARDAKLAYPKGVAVSAENVLYFADGTNLRMVDKDGIISTIVGNHRHRAHWKPMPCEGTLSLSEAHLRWPTALAINPLDNALHVVDDHMIVKLTPDDRIKIVAGRPLHCAPVGTNAGMFAGSDMAAQASLTMPQGMAFAPNGDLYVAESDAQRINRVRRIGTDGRIAHVAGLDSKCNCLDPGCTCFDEDHFLATASRFHTVSAIAVTPDGILHLCDQANLRIRAVISVLPEADDSRNFEIFAPEGQVIYVFNRFGQHVATRNMVTGKNVYVFTYNVNTSNGKLSTVTDAAGNKVFILRDYANQVSSIENTKGQKCRLKMSRTRLLQEFSTPEGLNSTFDYHGSTGLLRTRWDSTGSSSLYSYDENGRLISAVSPTGEMISLVFDLSLKGASVQVTHGEQAPVTYFIKNSRVSRKTADVEETTALLPDRGVITVTPWSHTVTLETVAYPVLSDLDPVLGESFPIPGKQKLEIGGELVNRFEWRYYLRRKDSRTGVSKKRDIAQVGKRMRVNGENLAAVEYDKDSLTEALFMEDRLELLNISYDEMSRPVAWTPRGSFATVEIRYDRYGQLAQWKHGELTETYNYDRSGRLAEVAFPDNHKIVYTFKDPMTSMPSQITTASGHTFLIQYDAMGALQSLTTPRGHIHSFAIQLIPGYLKILYYSPVHRNPYKLLLDDQGRLVSKMYPGQTSRIVHLYDNASRLATVLAGISESNFDYYEDTGLLRALEVKDRPYELKTEWKYHGGLVKEEKMRYGSKTGLDNARFRQKYDGNGRLALIETEINGKELPPHAFLYNPNLGLLEGINDLRIYRNAFNRTVMQDTAKHYFRISDWDKYGRSSMTLINVKGYDAYKIELEFDILSRITRKRITLGQRTSTIDILYTPDGAVSEYVGGKTWKYSYDDNGNIIAVSQDGQRTTMTYDAGDRVVGYGDVEYVSYDAHGFVVRRGGQKLLYNDRGQLAYVTEAQKYRVWYNYDHQGRLAAWRDDKGNVTQFFYANPLQPHCVTHVHSPKEGRTVRYLYDEKGHVVAMERPDQRYYIANDESGSPAVVFNVHGTVMKTVDRTPFGRVIHDTEPDLYVAVDFRGGILDPHSGLIHFGSRVYDPLLGQWLTPNWEALHANLKSPTDIFIYRYYNNDPVNLNRGFDYRTDMRSWMELFGYDLSALSGPQYTSAYAPTLKLQQQDCASSVKSPVPAFGVISGLQCLTQSIQSSMDSLTFVPVVSLKAGQEMRRNSLPPFAHRKPTLGEGLLLSRVSNRVVVTALEGTSNTVMQDVLTSVLNSAHFLDVRTVTSEQDVLYFVKESQTKMRDDQEELRRLSGAFNISLSEGDSGSWELRISNSEVVLNVIYGSEVEPARHRALRIAHRRAVEAAWVREKQLVEMGLPGLVDWSVEEKVELLTRGEVDGFVGSDLHNIYHYPQLADDPSNVIFRRDGRRKRRKSHRSRGH